MLFRIENIAKVKSAEVEISGLTVLTGLNNTGKSTIGKALFALVEGFAQAEDFGDEIIEEARIKILHLLEPILEENIDLYDYVKWIIFSRFGDEVRESIIKINELISLWDDENYADKYPYSLTRGIVVKAHQNIIEVRQSHKETIQKIKAILEEYPDSYSSELVIKRSINYLFRSTFDNDFSPIMKTGLISTAGLYLDTLGVSLYSDFKENSILGEIVKLENSFFNRAIYIENPQSINREGTSFSFRRARRYQVSPLEWSLARALDLARRHLNKGYDQISLFDSATIKFVRNRIEDIIGGRLISKAGGRFYYKQSDGAEISMANSASGLKSFFILYALLISEQLNSKTIIIIDEPEVNLHPAWEVEYARLIIDLVGEGYYFFINTHSPYMIKAFDSFSKQKEDVRKKCFIYQMVKDDTYPDMYVSRDVTDNLEPVFKDLAAPYSEIL